MKLTLSLGGATTKKDLLAPKACFNAGKDATQILDGLLFSAYYFASKPPGKPITPSELSHISAGIYSSGVVAKRMMTTNIPDDLKAKARKYAGTAESLNRKVRSFIAGDKKTGAAPLPFTEQERLKVLSALQKLKASAEEFGTDAEKLCYVKPEVKLVTPMKRVPKRLTIKRTAMGSSDVRVEKVSVIDRPMVVEQAQVVQRPKVMYPSFSRPAFHRSRRKS